MRPIRAKWLGMGVLLVATTVLAQPAPGGDAEVGFRKASQLTVADQLAQTDAYIAKMRATLEHITTLAGQAHKEKDIIKLNCVNDKLVQIKGNLNVAEQSRDALKAVAERSDDGARNHEFAKLTIMYQKVTVLGQEAEQCIGEEISYVGATRVEVDVDKDIPEEDPTVIPPPSLPVVRPPLASPFL
jgi:hypothetical protein